MKYLKYYKQLCENLDPNSIEPGDEDLDFLNGLDLLDNNSLKINQELEVRILNSILNVLGRDNTTIYSFPDIEGLVSIIFPNKDWILQKLRIVNRDIEGLVTDHDYDINKIDFYDDLIYYAIDENQLEKLGLSKNKLYQHDEDIED